MARKCLPTKRRSISSKMKAGCFYREPDAFTKVDKKGTTQTAPKLSKQDTKAQSETLSWRTIWFYSQGLFFPRATTGETTTGSGATRTTTERASPSSRCCASRCTSPTRATTATGRKPSSSAPSTATTSATERNRQVSVLGRTTTFRPRESQRRGECTIWSVADRSGTETYLKGQHTDVRVLPHSRMYKRALLTPV